MRTRSAAVWLSLALAVSASQAQSQTVICRIQVPDLSGDGTKARMTLKIGDDAFPAFVQSMQEYARARHMAYDPVPSPTFFDFSREGDGIHLAMMWKRNGILIATLSTESCFGPPADWHPYWDGFKALVRKNGYERLPPQFSSQ